LRGAGISLLVTSDAGNLGMAGGFGSGTSIKLGQIFQGVEGCRDYESKGDVLRSYFWFPHLFHVMRRAVRNIRR